MPKMMSLKDRESGTVKWFDPVKGFGFILRKDGSEIFVHYTDIQGEGRRALKRQQPVSFSIDREDRGLRATDVAVEEEAPAEVAESPSPQEPYPTGPVYRRHEILTLEEDREVEFKSLRKAKDPVKTMRDYYAAEYINAFLNTHGGVILFGIENDGRVLGLELDRTQRDVLRTEISKIVNKFQPSVEPDLYKIKFIPVLAKTPNSCVVEIHVSKGTASLYMTGSQSFYLRRDGSNFLMPFDMIRTRLQASDVQAPVEPLAIEPREPPADATKEHDAAFDLDLGILLAMVFMSWSARRPSAEEIQMLQHRARDEGLEDEDVNVLIYATRQPPLLETIVSYLPTPESRKAAATTAYLVALSDNVLMEQEQAAFEQMCEALGLTAEERKEIQRLGESRLPYEKLNRSASGR